MINFLFFIYFFITIFIAWYLPGNFFLRKVLHDKFQRRVIATLAGMALWGWQGFIFGYLEMRWLTYFYIIFFLTLYLFDRRDISKIALWFRNIKKIRID